MLTQDRKIVGHHCSFTRYDDITFYGTLIHATDRVLHVLANDEVTVYDRDQIPSIEVTGL